MRKRKTWKKGLTAVLTGGLLLQTAGCSAGSVDTSSETSQESSAEETGQEETTGQAGTAAETEMADEAGQRIEDAKYVMQALRLHCPYALQAGDILRKVL